MDSGPPEAGATADVVVESFVPRGTWRRWAWLRRPVGHQAERYPHVDHRLRADRAWSRYKAPDIVGVAAGGTMWLAGEQQDPPTSRLEAGLRLRLHRRRRRTLTALYHGI